MRLKPEEKNTPLSSCGGNGADTEKENRKEVEEVQHPGNAPESLLTATEFPRYHTGCQGEGKKGSIEEIAELFVCLPPWAQFNVVCSA